MRPSTLCSSTHRARSRRCAGDDGQLLLLVLVYTVIAGVLVTVVVNVSTAYLHRRSLVAAVDGAALSAANQPDLARVYEGGSDALPLSEEGTTDAVAQYVDDARLEERFDGFDVVDVSTDGRTVTVTFAATVRMPLLNAIASTVTGGGYRFDATARAESPLSPLSDP
jgi:Flp pilus assembly protein TadG